jgi:hypothetical protein
MSRRTEEKNGSNFEFRCKQMKVIRMFICIREKPSCAEIVARQKHSNNSVVCKYLRKFIF